MTESILKSRKTKEKLFSKKLRDPTFTNIDKFKEYNKLYAKTCRSQRYFTTGTNLGRLRAKLEILGIYLEKHSIPPKNLIYSLVILCPNQIIRLDQIKILPMDLMTLFLIVGKHLIMT